MREVTRSALTPYAPAQMFALVEDIERYPEFLPWVGSAELLERKGNEVLGRLEMHRAGVSENFITRNVLSPPREITLQLVSGPFRTLEGRWTFENIADRGARVSLSVRFEFANPLFGLLLTRSFEKSCSDLLNAFITRARKMYG
ncbi:MAG TPA: type II toxin-antitoxin system RatA family toxin [Steroidobacter sp.]|nr:type II toxin-antitoxin system RatA family toxin [Steroidobacter sp.]